MSSSRYGRFGVWVVETVTIWTDGEWAHDMSFRTREEARRHARDMEHDYPAEVKRTRVRGPVDPVTL